MNAVLHGVSVPMQRVTPLNKMIAAGLTSRYWHYGVLDSVCHENGRVEVGRVAAVKLI